MSGRGRGGEGALQVAQLLLAVGAVIGHRLRQPRAVTVDRLHDPAQARRATGEVAAGGGEVPA